jgi:branched-chain amino acid transport system ATP-binding protein
MDAFSRRWDQDTRTDFAAVLERFPILAQRLGQIAGTLSGGERQILVIGRALMAKPKCMMLEEPSLGLAPMIVNRIFETIAAGSRSRRNSDARRIERPCSPRTRGSRLCD